MNAGFKILVFVVVLPHVLFAGCRENKPDAGGTKGQKQEQEFAGQTDWPVFHGGQALSGFAEGSLADSFKIGWRFRTGGAVKASPVVRDGIVYCGSGDGNVYAVNLETGRRVWRFETDDVIEGACCAAGGLVYVGSA